VRKKARWPSNQRPDKIQQAASPVFIGKKREGNFFYLRNLAALRFLLPAPIPIISTFPTDLIDSAHLPLYDEPKFRPTGVSYNLIQHIGFRANRSEFYFLFFIAYITKTRASILAL
jgi:hypothetical protein